MIGPMLPKSNSLGSRSKILSKQKCDFLKKIIYFHEFGKHYLGLFSHPNLCKANL
jgi:hypothetical protein